MLTDAASIALALVAARFAARPASGSYTFGLGRAEILSAQVNGAALFVLAGVIAIEGVQRLGSTAGRRGGSIVIAVGVAGALVNVGAFWALVALRTPEPERRGRARARARRPLRLVRGGRGRHRHRHAAVRRRSTRSRPSTVAALMLRSGWSLLRALGARPAGGGAARHRSRRGRPCAGIAQAGVVEVHDLHVWEVTSGFPALAAHVVVAAQRRLPRAAGASCRSCCVERFAIRHTTLQVDHESWQELVEIEPAPASAPPAPANRGGAA